MKRLNIAGLLLLAAAGGCAGPNQPTVPQVTSPPVQNTNLAQSLTASAVENAAGGKEIEAEALFQQALAADALYGPAHNEMGVLYFKQRKMYQAAWEFQYAARLLPNHAEPKNNLGLVLEASGKFDDAIDAYAKAATIEPDNAQVLGNLARTHLRRGDSGREVRSLLTRLVERETRPDWLSWAKERLAALPHDDRP